MHRALTLIPVLAEAVAAGVILTNTTDGLVIEAPQSAASHTRQVRERETDVLRLFAPMPVQAGRFGACVLCGRQGVTRDVVDGEACHFGCLDALLTGRPLPPSVRASGLRATPPPRRVATA